MQATGALTTARIIAGALIAGVTTFALVAWVIVQQRGPLAPDPTPAPVMLFAWAGVTVGALLGALLLWRTRVAPRIEDTPAAAAPRAAAHDQALQASLVMVWALIEGPALFGVVVFLLFGSLAAFAAGLLLVWLGIGRTFPRTDWFA